jgi:hypothetical protein
VHKKKLKVNSPVIYRCWSIRRTDAPYHSYLYVLRHYLHIRSSVVGIAVSQPLQVLAAPTARRRLTWNMYMPPLAAVERQMLPRTQVPNRKLVGVEVAAHTNLVEVAVHTNLLEVAPDKKFVVALDR